MELRTATSTELTKIYNTFLIPSFPRAELRPLRAIKEMVEDGCYDPLVLLENGEPVGACFLWLGVPGWLLVDYLCVNPNCRNGGYGAEILRQLPTVYPGWVIFGESEDPAFAPDPTMAKRRLGFYARNHAKIADYDVEVFGVRYKTLYWADKPVDSADLCIQHRFVYESRFSPEKFAKHMRIPCPSGAKPGVQIPWEE